MQTEIKAFKISLLSVFLNMFLSVIKLIGGILGNSYAVISDAINSASDVFYSLIVMIGVKISTKKADKKHQFGHERFECVAAILLSFILFLTGVTIGYTGFNNIITKDYLVFKAPSVLALCVTCVSICVKLFMFIYTYKAAKSINSSALKADAFNHGSDVLSSTAVVVGIICAMNGLLIFDSIASLVVCLLIIKAAIEVFVESIKKMTDEACDKDMEDRIREIILENVGVKKLDSLLTRQFGNRAYVIAEIACDKNLTLESAHEIAENVHDSVEKAFPCVKHITVHVNPYNE